MINIWSNVSIEATRVCWWREGLGNKYKIISSYFIIIDVLIIIIYNICIWLT